MALQLERGNHPPDRIPITRIASRAGVSRPTVYNAIRELTNQGLYPFSPSDRLDTEAYVRLPVSLITDRDVHAQAKVFYGKLKLLQRDLRPQGGSPNLRFTYSLLAELAQMHRKTAAKAVRTLANGGWLMVERSSNKQPAKCRFKDPSRTKSEVEVQKMVRRLKRASFQGEALMREYLSLLIDSEEFEDDAAPGFLVNPLTDERLQLDRYYPPSVAFEFNGPQHYGPTNIYSAEDARKQRARDLIKMGLCADRKITLVIVHPQDLTLSKMREKVGNLLPLRDLSNDGPRIAYLQAVARSYRRRALSNPFHTPRD